MSENKMVKFVTNKGTFVAEIFADKVPVTAKNFLNLVSEGFYDGIVFHRVIEGFMIQGGDPTGTGMGGSENHIEDEFVDDLVHDAKGILSMANAGPNTARSQFFITLDETPWLDGHHAVFGKVVKGLEVVEEIGQVETDFSDRPLDEVVMMKVSIKE